eukprot:TRINITY_DN12238_c0_g1_i1.p1 TRINITY_DN12238_c0_g1~~TRINITY_DN12238_c0_g1_i1.p1  ORF type:complete len:868 (+),score=156.57 TRINITY_DN12238_c0_g1_i1:52-2655(+)
MRGGNWVSSLFTAPTEYHGRIYYDAVDVECTQMPFDLDTDANPFVLEAFQKIIQSFSVKKRHTAESIGSHNHNHESKDSTNTKFNHERADSESESEYHDPTEAANMHISTESLEKTQERTLSSRKQIQLQIQTEIHVPSVASVASVTSVASVASITNLSKDRSPKIPSLSIQPATPHDGFMQEQIPSPDAKNEARTVLESPRSPRSPRRTSHAPFMGNTDLSSSRLASPTQQHPFLGRRSSLAAMLSFSKSADSIRVTSPTHRADAAVHSTGTKQPLSLPTLKETERSHDHADATLGIVQSSLSSSIALRSDYRRQRAASQVYFPQIHITPEKQNDANDQNRTSPPTIKEEHTESVAETHTLAVSHITKVPSRTDLAAREQEKDKEKETIQKGRRNTLWMDPNQAKKLSQWVFKSGSDDESDGETSRMSDLHSTHEDDEIHAPRESDKKKHESTTEASEKTAKATDGKKKRRFLPGFLAKHVSSHSSAVHKTSSTYSTGSTGNSAKYKVVTHEKGSSDPEGLTYIQRANSHDGPIFVMKFNTAGTLLATAGKNGRLVIWEVAESVSKVTSDNQIPDIVLLPNPRILHAHEDDILDICWCEDEDILLTASLDRTVKLWLLSESEPTDTFVHDDVVTCVAFHPQEKRLFVSGSFDKRIRLWDVIDGEVVLERNTDSPVSSIIFVDSGTQIIAGGINGACKIYETEGLAFRTAFDIKQKRSIKSFGKRITGFDLTKAGDKLLVSSCDSRIRLYNLNDLTLFCKYQGHELSQSQIRASFGPGGDRIIVGSENHGVYVWDTKMTYNPRNTLKYNERRDRNKYWEKIEGHSNIVTGAIYHPHNGSLILTSDYGGTIHIFHKPYANLAASVSHA